METLETYRRAQDILDAVLAAVPADKWDAPSACEMWTVRDVAGHAIWGQNQLRAWATGQSYSVAQGAPGTAHPGVLTGPDPVSTWRTARAAATGILSDDALARKVNLPGLGEQSISEIVTLLITDHLAHAWDIGHPLGLDIPLDPELIPGSFAWARANVFRSPGFFGPELTVSPGADEQTRWLAYLGRDANQPATV